MRGVPVQEPLHRENRGLPIRLESVHFFGCLRHYNLIFVARINAYAILLLLLLGLTPVSFELNPAPHVTHLGFDSIMCKDILVFHINNQSHAYKEKLVDFLQFFGI